MCNKRRLPLVSEMKEPPVPGRFYYVPAVFYYYLHISDKPAWWPVLGPKHDDAEHLEFPWPHYHLDRRFMSESQMQRTGGKISPSQGDHNVAISPILQPIGDIGSYGTMPQPVLRRMKCQRAEIGFPDYPEDNKKFKAFHASFIGKKCPRDAEGHLICPHKGARLSSLVPNAEGIITCPLHGLLIDPATETVVG